MNTLKPIALDNGYIQIHPYRKKEMMRETEIVNELFEIFGDIESIPFNKEKLVTDKKTISMNLLGVVIGYDQQIRYTHFLTHKDSDTIIGEIIITTPKHVKSIYNLDNTWIIEYYLNKQFWNRGIMSGAISAIIHNMKGQGIDNIGALVDEKNTPSIRVLEKVGFVYKRQFDLAKDLYLV